MGTRFWPAAGFCAAFLAGSALILYLHAGGAAIGAAISGEAGREAIVAAIWRHVGEGVVAAPLLIAYLFWRVAAGAPPAGAISHIQRSLLWALVALIAFLIVSGPVVVWTYGSALKVFDWFALPSPTGKLPVVHDPLEAAHLWAGRAAPWLVAAEAAAFGHGLIRRRPA